MNFRKFATIFCIIAVIFLAISGGLLANEYFDTSGNDNPADASPTPANPEDNIPDDGPFNILIGASETKKGDSDILIVANYDPEKNFISLLSIPSNLKADVPLNNGVRMIKSSYKSNGAENTSDLLSSILNIRFKYYLFLDYSTLSELVDLHDGVNFDLPADLKSSRELSGIDINLTKGKQQFDGNMVNQFLRFKDPIDNRYSPELLQYYNGTNLSRTSLTQSFFNQFFLQKFNTEYLSDAERVYNQIIDKVDTNITLDNVMGFVERSKDINVQNTRLYILSGEDQKSGNNYFVYDGKINESNSTRIYNDSDIINNYFKSPAFVSKD